MTNEYGRIWVADEGCFIVRKSDNWIMGDSIDLGTNDSIDNYEDQPYTAESRAEFFDRIGEEDPLL